MKRQHVTLVFKTISLLFLSFILVLAFGQAQLYFLTSSDSPISIDIGYPYTYYYFSRDGNGLHGSNILNFLKDFGLMVLLVFGISWICRFVKNKRS